MHHLLIFCHDSLYVTTFHKEIHVILTVIM